jgi:RNA polymerase sigma factor (sigma-70 family)
MAAHAAPAQPATLDPERDFVRLRAAARRRFLARARRAGQHAFHDLDQAADDAYQEAWLEVARRPDAAPIEGDPAGYLAGIMWHRFYQRELRRVQPRLVELSEGDDAHTVETPEEAALRSEAARAVQLALSSLPERERRALVLRALGLPHRDVAASLGVSPLRARKLADAGRREFGARVAAGEQGEPCASSASCLRAIAAGWHISAHRRARLDAHLYACPACRGTLAALRREGALATGPLVIAAPGWWQQVLASVHEAFRGALGRGGEGALTRGEIATGGGAVGGGTALVGKLAAGCATVCLIGGGVAVVAEQTVGHGQDRTRTTARSPAGPPSSATTIAAVSGVPAEVAAERRMKAAAAEQRAKAAAQDAAHRAQVKARHAARQAARAARKARQAAGTAAAARTKAEAAAAVGQRAAATGQQAAASGQQAAQAGAAAGQQAAQKAQRALSGALGGYGG